MASADTTVAPANKLFMLFNGELKQIRSSNIAKSGILLPVKKSGPQNKKTLPNFIVNNEIRGGIMTLESYRKEVENHKRLQGPPKPVNAKPLARKVIYKVIRPTDIQLELSAETVETPSESQPSEVPIVQKNRPGRRKGVLNKKKTDQSSLLGPVPGSKTRSGRVSRPPRHIQTYYSKDAEDATISADDKAVDPDLEVSFDVPLPRKPKRFLNRFNCPQCGKIYVSERKLSNHMNIAHDFVTPEEKHEQIDCFSYLLAKLKKIPLNLRGKMFLDEMETFVLKVQLLMKKLIRNLDERPKETFLNYSQVYQIPKSIEALLNFPSGQYHFNMEVIDYDNAEKPADAGSKCATTAACDTAAKSLQESVEMQIDAVAADETSTMPSNAFVEDSEPSLDTSVTVARQEFSDHIISLERDDDEIFPSVSSLTIDPAASNDNAVEGEDDDEDDPDDYDDDLITPKKLPNNRTRTKVKRIVKNLNKPEAASLTPGKSNEVPQHMFVMPPKIRDLSLELFQCQREPNNGHS